MVHVASNDACPNVPAHKPVVVSVSFVVNTGKEQTTAFSPRVPTISQILIAVVRGCFARVCCARAAAAATTAAVRSCARHAQGLIDEGFGQRGAFANIREVRSAGGDDTMKPRKRT